MRQSRRLWRIISVTAILATCIFIIGFIYAIKTVVFPQPSLAQMEKPNESERQPSDTGDIVILGLGDSLTKGTGDPTSYGYIRHVYDDLKQTHDEQVRLINLAINGYRAPQLLHDITSRSGVKAAIEQARLIVITIGGNDLFSVGEEVDLEAVKLRIPEALETIEQIMAEIDRVNAQAEVYYIGLYNPFIDMAEGQAISLVVQQWNHALFQIINKYPQMTFVPTFDMFQHEVSTYLSSDHYHPNQLGYAKIAERMTAYWKGR